MCHYSSAHFRTEIVKRRAEVGAEIPEQRWFTNLPTKGNTGSASVFLLLEELLGNGSLKEGQTVLAMVPESGRFITSVLQFTVVGHGDTGAAAVATPAHAAARPAAVNADGVSPDALVAEIKRRLATEWIAFAESLQIVPIVKRIVSGTVTRDDYRALLLNLRQQVVEGGRWISRAASSITSEYFEIRSMFVRHAAAEHRDFLMLEKDFVSVGGDAEAIRTQPKNIGSEALSAWMFQQANRENPFGLAGAMAIIEGLGNRVAKDWGQQICRTLGITKDQCTFMLYHGENDENHMAEMERALAMMPLSRALVEDIVHTARVTGRLYRLQLEELGNV
jgi:3-oxoacyl-[acyl-carrier-protein] synthase-3